MIAQEGPGLLSPATGELTDIAAPSSMTQERTLTSEELRDRVVGIMGLYPDVAPSLAALMECLGDTPPDNMTTTGWSDTDTPISRLLFENDTLGSDLEAADDVMDYIHIKRRDQLNRIYDLLIQNRPMPELFKAMAILGSPCTPASSLKPDSASLLHMQASVMHRTVRRYGLAGPDEVMPAFNFDAWQEFMHQARHLERDPPTKPQPESADSQDDDFSQRKTEAIYALRESFNELLNIAGSMSGYNTSTGEILTINGPFEISRVGLMCADPTEEGECCDDADHELAMVVSTGDDADTILHVAQYAESFASHGKYLDEEMFFRTALLKAMAGSYDYEEVSWQFAAACVSMASDRTIYVYTDPAEASLGSLFRDSYLLLKAGGDDTMECREHELALDEPEQTRGTIAASNLDERSGKTWGNIEAKNLRWIIGRMVCFNPGLVIETACYQPGEDFDLQLRLELPLTTDGLGQKYMQPYVPGFKLAGYQPVEGTSEHLLQYMKIDDDPYQREEVPIASERLQELAASIDGLGLYAAAAALRDSSVETLEDVWHAIEPSLVYGNGKRRIALYADKLEDLRLFVEDGQLVGVCSLFAALAAFSINVLMPDAETRILSGHKLKLQGISQDGHAQVLFKLPGGKSQIVDLHAWGYRDVDPLPTPVENVMITAGNIQALLTRTFMDKFGLPDTKSLIRHLARQPAENFSRQLYSLALAAAEIETGTGPSAIDLLDGQLSDLETRMKLWLAAPEDVRKGLKDAFGEWSYTEVSYFSDVLKQLKKPVAKAI